MAVRRTFVAAIAAGVLAASQSAPATISSARTSAASAGARWIGQQQRSNGAFFADDYPAQDVAETVASIVAGGVTGAPVDRALGYIATHGEAAATEAAYAARIVLGLVAAGKNPRSFAGFDFVARLESFYSPATGAYDARLYADALAILGVVAAKHQVPQQAITYLRANQCANGGFGHDPACASNADVDTTALVLVALVRAGVSSDESVRSGARDWLRSQQNDDGGFSLNAGDASNANSTALVASALAVMGEDWRSKTGSAPATALLKLQFPSGGFAYLPGDSKPNAYATVQAVPGIAGLAFPILPPPTVKGGRVTIPPRESGRATPATLAATAAATATPSARDPFLPPARSIASGSTAPRAPARSAAAVWLAAILAAGVAGLLGARLRRGRP